MQKDIKDLSEAELKDLYLAFLRILEKQQSKMCQVAKTIFNEIKESFDGSEIVKKTKEMIEAEKDYENWTAGIIAKRLKQNDVSVPLLNLQDMEYAINEAFINSGSPETNQYLLSLFKDKWDVLFAEDALDYEGVWKILNIIYNLAKKHKCCPLEFLSCDDICDEFMRNAFSKEEYIENNKNYINTNWNINLHDKCIPIIISEITKDEFDSDDILTELMPLIMPILVGAFEKCRIACLEWSSKEADRIYG